MTQPTWEPERRDSELRRIKGLTAAITVAAVGLAGAFTAGIAWADKKATTQSDGSSDSSPSDSATNPSPGISPPATSPKPSPSHKPKTKSGGS